MAGKFVAAVHVCNASGQGSAPVSHYNGVAHEQHIGLAATQTVIQRENQDCESMAEVSCDVMTLLAI